MPKKEYKRHMVAYKDYFKEFKKTLIYRIFCCFDEGNLVILFNGFQKKTQKTPQGEIDKAKRIMNEYFESKNKKGE